MSLSPRISQARLEVALRALARNARGRYLRCAETGQIMFDTPQLAGRAARLLHMRHAGRRWNTVRCGRHNHYHLKRDGDKA